MHKLRSFLTMLGIIFGVGAVVAMLSIGEGARLEALAQIEMMGVNNIIIKDSELKDQKLIAVRQGFSEGLTPDDVEAITSIIPQITLAAPLRKDELDIIYKGEKIKGNIIGTTSDYFKVQNTNLQRGRIPDKNDLKDAVRVCAIGYSIKRTLFPFSDAVGKDIKIGNVWFRVVGEFERKNISTREIGGFQVRNFNDDVIIPLTCSEKYFPQESLQSPLDQIIVNVGKRADIRAVGEILNRIISRRHHEQNDFKVIIPEELLRQSQSTQRIFNIVMGTIAGISLLVGGIGIMNIMLSSVLERTREIGIRRAVGATQSEIMRQFLTEAVTLSFSGGIIGVLLGIGLAKIITFYAGWITIVSMISVFSAFGVATGVGLIFGIYPARRAASLHPIEALRYE